MIVYAPLSRPWSNSRIHWLHDWNYQFIARSAESCEHNFNSTAKARYYTDYHGFPFRLERVA